MKSILVLIPFLFAGCVTKTEYVDRVVEVKVPVKCTVPHVERPIFEGGSYREFLRNLAEYNRKRDEAIKVCN